MFEKSLVYLCQHTENGALGLIVNKPTDIALSKLFEQVDLPLERRDLQHSMVLEGGPLHAERGFVLHERIQPLSVEPPSIVQGNEAGDGEDSIYASTLLVAGSNLELTTSTDIMHAIAQGGGPRQVLVTLGFASWGGGQLEEELAQNAWLALDAGSDPEALLFDTPAEQRYGAALKRLGLEPWMLGAGAGRA